MNYVHERFGVGRKPLAVALVAGAKSTKARKGPQKPQRPQPIARKGRNRSHNVDSFFTVAPPPGAENKMMGCLTQPGACKESWTVDENLFMQGLASGEMNLEQATEVAPKLAAITRSIIQTKLKTLVLLHSKVGAESLTRLLVQAHITMVYLCNTEHLPPKDQKILRAENAIRLHAFNHPKNRHGDTYQVAVAEAEEYSEGISFMHVRRIILDQGYGFKASWAMMEQRIGRALRSCSHKNLAVNLRNVQVDLFVSVHNQTQKYPPTIDLEKYLFIEKEIPLIQKGLDFLRNISIDASYYAAHGDVNQKPPKPQKPVWNGLRIPLAPWG